MHPGTRRPHAQADAGASIRCARPPFPRRLQVGYPSIHAPAVLTLANTVFRGVPHTRHSQKGHAPMHRCALRCLPISMSHRSSLAARVALRDACAIPHDAHRPAMRPSTCNQELPAVRTRRA
eukprot:619008-Prymnesium_polylepis.2